MFVMIIGLGLALSGVFLMQNHENLPMYAGVIALIVGIVLIKKGRDKANLKL